MPVTLLGAAEIRALAADLGVSPTKKLGQNFVIDPGTVRRIVQVAGVRPGERVVEVGGTYHHSFVRTPDGWRSRRLHERVAWTRGF